MAAGQGVGAMRFFVPRFIALLVVCVGVALTAAGCDPVTDRNYMDEGAGVALYTANGVSQTDLQNQYISYICEQAGLAACGNQAFNAKDWRPILEAGMNDIDQRCDGYLTWLDARRRDKEPVLAELAAMTAAASSIMTATGASVKALNIVTTAFGLAAISYTQWNSRLLISVEQSTVQNVVYNYQGKYRDTIKTYVVADRPTTIYLLRNYLRLCTPIVIEANINTSSTLVSFDTKPPVQSNLVLNAVSSPALIRNVNAPLPTFTPLKPNLGPTRLGPYEQSGMQAKDFKIVLDVLSCPSAADLGPAGSPARKALTKFLTDNGRTSSDRVTDSVFMDIRDLKTAGKKGTCS
jgi:hypothetical protein